MSIDHSCANSENINCVNNDNIDFMNSNSDSEEENIHEEYKYLKLCKKIIYKGEERIDRTKIGTKSLFGLKMKYNLNNSFPLLTTKKVFWKGVVLELLWMINGKTDSKILSDEGIHIWDLNSSREFLDKYGFKNREVGDLGPIYGFQWRHYGAKYIDHHSEYNQKGIDQLKYIVNKIQNDPCDRRIIMNAWNPVDLNQMALPPCHVMCQFYVSKNNRLSCQMYQRSADFGLGVPFNIASYSLLTYMIAHICDLELGEFIHIIGDGHVYLNHIDSIKEQIKRKPYPFPKLKILRKVNSIDDFKYTDFELIDYQHHSPIKMDMAI